MKIVVAGIIVIGSMLLFGCGAADTQPSSAKTPTSPASAEEKTEENTPQITQQSIDSSENENKTIRTYEFETHQKFDLNDTITPFRSSGLHLKPQGGGSYPVLNDLEGLAYEPLNGRIYLYVYSSDNELERGVSEILRAFETKERHLKIYKANNVLWIYKPAADVTDERVEKTNREIQKSIRTMMQSYADQEEINFSYTGPGKEGIDYSDEQKNAVAAVGKKYGVDPFIPLQGVSTDYLMEIRLKERSMKMVYPHFSVALSSEDFVEKDKEDKVEFLTIGNGKNAQWFEHRRMLYFKLNDVYIAITSAKSVEKDDFIKIAQSLSPLTVED